MARPTNDANVRALIPDTELDDLCPFITAANMLVNRMALTPCGSSFTEAELELIETWAAAHFAAVADPSVAIESEKVEGTAIKASRGNASTMGGLLSTQYGQMANTLSSGCLAEMDKRTPQVTFV